MASEAPVYRSSRLHTINPTAAINEDTSYLWTLVGVAAAGLRVLWCVQSAGTGAAMVVMQCQAQPLKGTVRCNAPVACWQRARNRRRQSVLAKLPRS
jgi:hypothetical protein